MKWNLVLFGGYTSGNIWNLSQVTMATILATSNPPCGHLKSLTPTELRLPGELIRVWN